MLNSLRVAWFLAVRYIRHANRWMTLLVVFVMMLTFLNLVVVTGILVGLVEGSFQTFREQYSGDILLSTLPNKSYIEQSDRLIGMLDSLDPVAAYSPRYAAGGSIEANYKRDFNRANVLPDTAGGEVVGIDPVKERNVTGLPSLVIEGSFLEQGDEDEVVLGANLIKRYIPASTGLETVSGVRPGDKVLVSVNDVTREMTVKGIIQSKTGQVDTRVYLTDTQLRKLIDRYDYNLDEIAVDLVPAASVERVQQTLKDRGADKLALVRTSREAVGDFLDDIQDTFGTLGNVIGAIGLVVASITIFIVIFITAITRQKSIGILKGIGISDAAIEFSYVFLSIFYSVIGMVLGTIVLYTFLVPYFQANPIDFPFSDGILAVTPEGTAFRAGLIGLTTIVAGYVPARIVVGKRALDAILGR